MAMSHADCDHPRTPAGRAACRKAGGPSATGLLVHDLDPPPDYDTEGDHPESPPPPWHRTCEGSVGTRYEVGDVSVGDAGLTARPAVVDKVTGRTVKVYRRTERALATAHAQRLNEAPEKPAEAPSRRGGTRRKALVGEARTRAVEHEHDLVNVPAAFGTVIRWAWDHNLGVRTGLPFNETERQIVIQSEHGWLTLVWRAGQPFGVTAVWWRPYDTSVQKRLMTVQQGLTALESGVWD
jgi:hypothetical protein